MALFPSSALLVLVLFAALPATQASEYAPFVTFNNGQVTTDRTCTSAEMTLITDAVARGFGGNRRRGLSVKPRKLQLLKCNPLLAWATHKCGGGTGGRRHALETASVMETQDAATTVVNEVRELNTNVCAANITKFRAVLDAVAPRVSAPCRSFLSVRSFECRKVLDCDITAFNTWNADTDRLIRASSPASNGPMAVVCDNLNVNFEAKTIFDVGSVRLTLTGPDGYQYSRQEHAAPYYVFGNRAQDVVGFVLSVGTYTLTAVAANAPNDPHTAQFRVQKCN